jgi:hypothetical protein
MIDNAATPPPVASSRRRLSSYVITGLPFEVDAGMLHSLGSDTRRDKRLP